MSFIDSPVGVGLGRTNDASSRLDADGSGSAPNSPRAVPVTTPPNSPRVVLTPGPHSPLPRAESPSRELARLLPGPNAQRSPSPSRSNYVDPNSGNAMGDGKSKKKVKKKKQAKDGKGKGKGGKPKGGKPKGGKNNNKGRGGGSPSG